MRTYPFDSPEGQQIMKENVAFYDKVRTVLRRRCKNCDYAISSLETCFALPEIGSVCELCYYMHVALRNPGLRSMYYFEALHAAWKKETDDPRRRDRLGL